MEKPIEKIYRSLQKLVGLHRQLLDVVRAERAALLAAQLKGIEDATYAKQGLIEAIKQAESERLLALSELVMLWKKPAKELTLTNLAIAIQGQDPKGAEQLRTSHNALTHLLKHVTDQNNDNRILVDKSLEHIHQMKKNVLEEATPRKDGYNQQGKRTGGQGASRLISQEA